MTERTAVQDPMLRYAADIGWERVAPGRGPAPGLAPGPRPCSGAARRGREGRELLAGTAHKFSLNRFYNKLKSQGYRVSRDSLRAWYGHLKEAYLVAGIPVASRSPQVRRVNPEKVYVIDTGLALAHAPLGAADTGHLLETAVYWELRRRSNACTWVRTRGGREVDFLAIAPGGEWTLVQVCADFRAAKTQERELAGLFEALEEFHVSEGLVVTFDHEEEFKVGQGRVQIVPAWKWFLLSPSNPDS